MPLHTRHLSPNKKVFGSLNADRLLTFCKRNQSSGSVTSTDQIRCNMSSALILRFLVSFLFLSFIFTPSSARVTKPKKARVHVRSYVKKNGTHAVARRRFNR